jgi:hypothetical protein
MLDTTRLARKIIKKRIKIKPPSALLAMLKIAKIRLRIIIMILAIGNISQNFPLFIKKSIARLIIVKIKRIINNIEPRPSLFLRE